MRTNGDEKYQPLGVAVLAANDHENTIFELVSMIEYDWDRVLYPNVYGSLLGIHNAQTRSIHLLNKGYCKAIYFTINNYDKDLKNKIEPKSPQFMDRLAAIEELHYNKIPVIPSFSPILPFITDLNSIIPSLLKYDTLNFEGLNFNLGNINKVIDTIAEIFPELRQKYLAMLNDNKIYNEIWLSVRKNIEKYAKENKKIYNIYIHGRKDYFNNTYNNL